MTGTSLHLDDIACIRGERLLFRGLSHRIDSGGCLVLTGPNGCGKSTLLRVLAGLARPFTGTVRLMQQGNEAAENPADHVAYIGHRDGIKAALTAREHLILQAALHGAGGDVQTLRPLSESETLDRMGLTRIADLPGRVLSSGQRRRVSLARLLIAPRPFWVLDEPGVGLDSNGSALLEDMLDTHLASGGMAAISTHTPIRAAGAHVLALDAYSPGPTACGDDIGQEQKYP